MTEPTPLDVAVQVDEIEKHKLKLTLAVRHGYQGSAIETFAGCLKGDSREAIEQDAANLAAELAEMRALMNPEPVNQPAVDPSQGMGRSSKHTPSERDRFADTLYNAVTR